jgi:mono/diheme cytochrome c family protein
MHPFIGSTFLLAQCVICSTFDYPQSHNKEEDSMQTSLTRWQFVRPIGLIAMAVLFMLVLGACIQPSAPAGSAAASQPEATAAPAEAMMGDPANGAYIATVTGGCGCHFNADLNAMAGGREFKGDFGVVYAPNLTSDQETGIAHDSDEILVSLLRTGQEEEDGEIYVLSPIMPYRTFSILSDKDAYDIVAWLRTLEPVANPVAERQLAEEPQPWSPETAPAAESPSEPVARGEYLVKLANCSGCHTPKNEDGSPKADMLLAGSPIRDEFASNITPDEGTGIGSWTEEQIATFIRTGAEPNGEQIEGAMAQQIERRFSKLTEADAAAIAAFLKSIPAVVNQAP